MIGIDKIRLHTNDFRIDDGQAAGLQLHQGHVDLDTGETKETLLFKDGLGKDVIGSRAVKNTDLFQLTIDYKGLSIQFNPSKPYHPYDLVSDTALFNDRCQTVFSQLKQSGINADYQAARLSRIDISRNMQMIYAVGAYSSVFDLVSIKREKYQRAYPDGYGTSNEDWGVLFYDKGKETSSPLVGLLRAEIQYKKARKVKTVLGCTSIKDVVSYGIPAISDVYRAEMKNKVLKLQQGNQLTIQFEDDFDLLKKIKDAKTKTVIDDLGHIKQVTGRNVINEFLIVRSFADMHSNEDDLISYFSLLLTQAGFSRSTILRELKAVRQRLLVYNSIYGNHTKTAVSKLFRELVTKIAA